MSRRRGVVRSDDESTPAPPSRSSRHSTSTTTTAGPGPSRLSKHVSRPTEPAADLDLPNLAILSPEEVSKIRLLETENHALTQKVASAMAIISDAAVEVEGLKVSAANQEVSIPINPYPCPCRQCKFGCAGGFVMYALLGI
jgi:hypothetical protein